MSKITFPKTNPFFKSLKQKVDNYFETTTLLRSGNVPLYVKGVLQISIMFLSYTLLILSTPSVLISILLCIMFGVTMALIGFNIMHEGGHHSFSSNNYVNNIAAYSLNVLGGNSYFWKIKHNVFHHTYTNIDGMDSDIELGPLLRMHLNQKKYWYHKYQHIYCLFLYGLSYFSWIFLQDFVKYFKGIIATGHGKQSIHWKEHVIFWLTKIVYTFVYIVIPVYFKGFGAWLIGFSIASFSCGIFIGLVFQLAHAVEGTDFPQPTAENLITEEWAVHQIRTTANFATKSKLVSWMLGGLNFQVEHHLFPKISHIHYPVINQFVKETCLEFGILYNEFPTVGAAIQAHLYHVKALGK